jgi:hypothetical protein
VQAATPEVVQSQAATPEESNERTQCVPLMNRYLDDSSPEALQTAGEALRELLQHADSRAVVQALIYAACGSVEEDSHHECLRKLIIHLDEHNIIKKEEVKALLVDEYELAIFSDANWLAGDVINTLNEAVE